MKKTVFISTLILLLALFNCSRKPVVTCGLGDLESRQNMDSEIVQMERIAIADTTIASVSGEILAKDSSAAGVVIDTLIASLVIFTDKSTGKTYGSQTDMHGKYHCFLPASTYDIKVQYIAYNTLIVRNVSFGTGDIVRFNAILGQLSIDGDSTVFEMQADKTIKRAPARIDTNK